MSFSSPSDILQVAYASDENYVPVMGVSIMSLLDKNRGFKEIHIYVLDDGISAASRAILENLVGSYGEKREVSFIPAAPLLESVGDRIKSYGCVPNGKTTFARLFLSDLLPDMQGRLLYIDCDTLVCDSLTALLHLEMQGRCIG
ncbi:MAG: hypothetical protein IJU95_02270, partial [Treponema sp.]|nr:hypothetical protein [Treponema sp.]